MNVAVTTTAPVDLIGSDVASCATGTCGTLTAQPVSTESVVAAAPAMEVVAFPQATLTAQTVTTETVAAAPAMEVAAFPQPAAQPVVVQETRVDPVAIGLLHLFGAVLDASIRLAPPPKAVPPPPRVHRAIPVSPR